MDGVTAVSERVLRKIALDWRKIVNDWSGFRADMLVPGILARFYKKLLDESIRTEAETSQGSWVSCMENGDWRIETNTLTRQARLRNLRGSVKMCLPEDKMHQFWECFLRGIPLLSQTRRAGTAVVFSGGGAMGAYQIGAWKALCSEGLDRQVTGFSGTSIGAVNILLAALGDQSRSEHLWMELSNPDLRQKNRRKINRETGYYANRFWQYGPMAPFRVMTEDFLFISQEELRHELLTAISGKTEYLLERYDMFSTATDITLFADWIVEGRPAWRKKIPELPHATYFYWNRFSAEEIVQAALASSAMLVLYNPIRLREQVYCDGGLMDDVPVKPLYECGYRRFIIIYLDWKKGQGYRRVQKHLKKHPDCRAIQIVPDRENNLFTMLNLTLELTGKRIVAGYNL